MMADELLPLFKSIGLSEQKAKETAKNEKVSQSLKALIVEVIMGHVFAKFQAVLYEIQGENCC